MALKRNVTFYISQLAQNVTYYQNGENVPKLAWKYTQK